jgi:hypothetical protein
VRVRRSNRSRWRVPERLCIALTVPLLASAAGSVPAGAARHPAANPYSPAYRHPARHGAVPTRSVAARMRAYRAAHRVVPVDAPDNLAFGGGVDGIGVTTGPPRVFLVFWGSQWGAADTDGNGDVTLSGDPQGVAPRVQQLMRGLGEQSELWSGVMTQYCEGVSPGAQSCPDGAAHAGYPAGGALAGVWEDDSAPAPGSASQHDIAAEAVAAASHFGNTTASSNRSAQYVVVSPTGTTPDGFDAGGGFCGWHDWNGDRALTGGPVASGVGDVAFTNLPYLPDAGFDCGAAAVNATPDGVLDGVTIIEGHEYAETITDQNPSGGWTDDFGEEDGDKCAWLFTGPGAAADVDFATGSFAMQSTWSNDDDDCAMSHPIVGGGAWPSPNAGNRQAT